MLCPPGSDGFTQSSWRVSCDDAFPQGDGPGTVEVLADEDNGFGVASAIGSRGYVDDDAAQAHGVIVADRSLVGEGYMVVDVGG